MSSSFLGYVTLFCWAFPAGWLTSVIAPPSLAEKQTDCRPRWRSQPRRPVAGMLLGITIRLDGHARPWCDDRVNAGALRTSPVGRQIIKGGRAEYVPGFLSWPGRTGSLFLLHSSVGPLILHRFSYRRKHFESSIRSRCRTLM